MKDDAVASLRALTTDGAKRSKIGRLRELFDEIENANKAGVKMEDIRLALKAQGLDIPMSSFKTLLHRVRQERLEQGQGQKSLPPIPANAGKSATITPRDKGSEAKPPSSSAPKKPGEPERFDWTEQKSQDPKKLWD